MKRTPEPTQLMNNRAQAEAYAAADFAEPNTFCAAYSLTEVAVQLRQTGLRGCVVRTVSDHHLAVFGRCRFRKDPPVGMFC